MNPESVLAPSVAHIYPIKYPTVPKGQWSVVERAGIVDNDYFHRVVAALVNSIPSGRIMVLVKRIQHGDALHALIPESFWISGRDDMESRYFFNSFSMCKDVILTSFSPSEKR